MPGAANAITSISKVDAHRPAVDSAAPVGRLAPARVPTPRRQWGELQDSTVAQDGEVGRSLAALALAPRPDAGIVGTERATRLIRARRPVDDRGVDGHDPTVAGRVDVRRRLPHFGRD